MFVINMLTTFGTNECLASKIFHSVTAILIGETIRLLWNIFYEHFKYRNNYDPGNRLLNIIKITFYVDWRCTIMLYLYILYLIWFLLSGTLPKDVSKEITISIAYIILKLFHFNSSLLEKAKWIRAGIGLDYGGGMASNYFHAYFTLNLPDKGDDKKGIMERCTEYEETNQIEFATKKLIVLIPNSMHTMPQIDSPLLERVDHLEPLERNRVGVKRQYKNYVYRLTTPINGKFYYIVLEGAGPLQSFYESCFHLETKTPEMVALKREILFQFYRSIRKYCSKCPDTKNLVHFIYYNDYDASGNSVDVGEIVKNYILKILNDKEKNQIKLKLK